eukprot:COSAG01_NODE_29080_length_646_cov_0.561243_2_plen_35_part_01
MNVTYGLIYYGRSTTHTKSTSQAAPAAGAASAGEL